MRNYLEPQNPQNHRVVIAMLVCLLVDNFPIFILVCRPQWILDMDSTLDVASNEVSPVFCSEKKMFMGNKGTLNASPRSKKALFRDYEPPSPLFSGIAGVPLDSHDIWKNMDWICSQTICFWPTKNSSLSQ